VTFQLQIRNHILHEENPVIFMLKPLNLFRSDLFTSLVLSF